MFRLNYYESEFLVQLDQLIKVSEGADREKLLAKKLELLRMLHFQEIEWLKNQLERQKIDDKFVLERANKPIT